MYVTTRSSATFNYGGTALVNNVWYPSPEQPGPPDFVITEIASICSGASGTDLVGVVNGKIPGIYANGYYVFGAEYWVNGVGEWLNVQSTAPYVQVHSFMAPGMTLPSSSRVDGTQVEYEMAVVYRDNVSGAPPAWWLRLNYNYIGYIPANTFSSLSTSACYIDFYGEAFDPSHTTSPWMNADMGSGARPLTNTKAGNYRKVAYMRLPTHYRAKNLGNANTGSVLQPITASLCYDGRRTTDGGSSWNPTLWLGGPGGNGAGCN